MEQEDKLKDSIEPVNIEGTKKILDQLMNYICKIKVKGRLEQDFSVKFIIKK